MIDKIIYRLPLEDKCMQCLCPALSRKKDKLRTAVAAALLLGDMKHGPAAATEAD